MENQENLREEIRRRNADLRSDWWPFVQNMEDILAEMKVSIITICLNSENTISDTISSVVNICLARVLVTAVDTTGDWMILSNASNALAF